MSKIRLPLFDIARALCALHIIIAWHGVMYFWPDSVVIKIGTPITIAALSCFTFLSGLLNNLKEGNISFYKNRAKRLYLPFVISYFMLIAIGLNEFSLKYTLLSLTGLSCFAGGQPNTLWYICMLLIFYAITPLLLQNCNRLTNGGRKKIALRGGGLFLILYIINNLVSSFDTRILYYFPFYILGLLFHPKILFNLIDSLKNVNAYLCGGIALFGLTILFSAYNNTSYSIIDLCINWSYGFWGVILILLSSKILSPIPHAITLFNKISYASMFAYMFHRVVFFLCINTFTNSINILITGSILSFFTSYWMQKCYDHIITKGYIKR